MRLEENDHASELAPGAYNAIHTCLRLQPEERVTLITDLETLEIAGALVREIENVEVDALSQRLVERARKAKQIRVTSGAGTDLVADFAPHLKWLKTSGIISPDKWGNLPGGEVFTSPWTVNGRFVCDGVVGEFAIGTNIAVEDVRGNILQDEKIPGVHIAFGHPYAEHTGQDWVSTTHIDCVAPREVTVRMDGEAVMRDGQFLI